MSTSVFLAAALAGAGIIDTSGFNDSRHHWRSINQPERTMQAVPDQPSYAAGQVDEIAANVLLFQRANGGWPKDYDMLAILNDDQKQRIRDSHDANDTSFDNHNVFPQVEYLARAFALRGNPAWREACVRGLDFMLGAQYANGGFPQRWPKPSGIGAHITFNDGVMIGILQVLRDAARPAPHFSWLDRERRERARLAVQRGVQCLLRMQVLVDGVPTAWGQQHDARTLAPAPARTFEPACLAPGDTAEIVEFLMGEERPSREVVAAVEAAIAWLRKVGLSGVKVERVPAPPAEYFRHKTDFDVVVVPDAKAPPLWPRMVEIATGRALFADRSGKIAYALAEIDRERRTGSGWFVTSPRRLLETDYPRWRRGLPE
ncbi:MAG: pectate lyase [Verrucomicrobia bacterium]|nr:pectate lyase [Verrucomicrobiota bacterium]